jgi:hypothetical protein
MAADLAPVGPPASFPCPKDTFGQQGAGLDFSAYIAEGTGETTIVWHTGKKFYDPETGELVGPPITDREMTEERWLQNRKRSLRRAKKEQRLFIVKNGTGRMWTLTFARATELHEREWVIAQVNDFMQRLRVHLGEAIPYTYVLELHPEGHGWHVHLALPKRFIDKHRLQALWGHGLVQFSDGNRWIQKRGAGGRRPSFREQCRRTAHYLSKYLGKTFDEFPPGVRRYETAKGFAVERVARSFRTFTEALSWLETQHQGDVIEHIWDSGEAEDWDGPPCWCVRFT